MKKTLFTAVAFAVLATFGGITASAAPFPKPPVDGNGNLPAAAPDSGATILLLGASAAGLLLVRRRIAARAS